MSTLQPRLCPRCIRPCHGAPMRSCAVSARCGCYRTVRLRSCALRHPHGATTIAVGRCERALEIMVGRFHRALQPRGDETLAAMGLTTAPALPPAADPCPHTADNCGSISPPRSRGVRPTFGKKKLGRKNPEIFPGTSRDPSMSKRVVFNRRESTSGPEVPATLRYKLSSTEI